MFCHRPTSYAGVYSYDNSGKEPGLWVNSVACRNRPSGRLRLAIEFPSGCQRLSATEVGISSGAHEGRGCVDFRITKAATHAPRGAVAALLQSGAATWLRAPPQGE